MKFCIPTHYVVIVPQVTDCDRQTDRRTTCRGITALCVASRGKNQLEFIGYTNRCIVTLLNCAVYKFTTSLTYLFTYLATTTSVKHRSLVMYWTVHYTKQINK